ncbi:MAG: hypothetical protein WD751_03685 [Anaerolineales bacterium]
MKFGKRVSLIALTALLLATAVVPALAASEVNLEIKNKTETTVNLVLSGPTDLKLTITRLTTNVRVEPGLYTYRYVACGLTNTGTFTVGSGGGTLTLKKCEKGLYGTIVVDNRTGSTFTLTLTGPKRYVLTIKPGDNKLTLLAGRYQYSARACGETVSGAKAVKSGSKSPDWIWRCD